MMKIILILIAVLLLDANEENKNNKEYSKNKRFKCDDRKHCSQMKSCEEAVYFINNCSNTKMDGDKDGKPCEDECGH